MSESPPHIFTRKSDHIDLAISGDVGFHRTTLLEEVTFSHCALPEVSWDSIDLSTRLVGIPMRSPIIISAMTGGTNQAGQINHQLAEVAERGGYAIGLGSQRAMVKSGRLDADVGRTYQLRSIAPTTLIFGNIGVVQASEMSTELVEEMVQFVDANALCIHLNPAQEMIQRGGDRNFRGGLAAIERLNHELSVPLIIKETGCGISRNVAARLGQVGVQHVDVAGAGGTSWVGVETRRAQGTNQQLGETFWDWGIPTAASLLEIADNKFKTVIASGGLKTGLDMAKAIALGAHGAGVARPIIQALDRDGIAGAFQHLQQMEEELKTALLLTGSSNLAALRQAPRIIGAALRAWVAD